MWCYGLPGAVLNSGSPLEATTQEVVDGGWGTSPTCTPTTMETCSPAPYTLLFRGMEVKLLKNSRFA